jgi:hypothetical protein
VFIVHKNPHHKDLGVNILKMANTMARTPTTAVEFVPFEYICRFRIPITTNDGFFRFLAMSRDDMDNSSCVKSIFVLGYMTFPLCIIFIPCFTSTPSAISILGRAQLVAEMLDEVDFSER